VARCTGDSHGVMAALRSNGGQGMVPLRLRTPSGKTALFYGALPGEPVASGGVAFGQDQVALHPPPPSHTGYLPADLTSAGAPQVLSPADPVAALAPDGEDDEATAGAAVEEHELVQCADEMKTQAGAVVETPPPGTVADAIHLQQQVGAAPEMPPPATFADAIQMQQLQQVQLMQQAYQSQQMQLMQQAQEFQYMYQTAQGQNMCHFAHEQEVCAQKGLVHNVEPQGLPQTPYELDQGMYPMQDLQECAPTVSMQMHAYQAANGQSSVAETVQMQQYGLLQSELEHYSHASSCSAPAGGGHVKNHALEAVAEALDRAEIGMLMGAQTRSQRGQDSELSRGALGDPGLAMHGGGGTFAEGGSTNFALQAAVEALGAATGDDHRRPAGYKSYISSDAHFSIDQSSHTRDDPAHSNVDGMSVLGDRRQGAGSPDAAVIDRPIFNDVGTTAATVDIKQNKRQNDLSAPAVPQQPRANEPTLWQHQQDGPPPSMAAAPPSLGAPPMLATASSGRISPTPPTDAGLTAPPGRSEPRCTPCPLTDNDEEDDELELLAQREMQNDAVVDFCSHRPPRPPSLTPAAAAAAAALVAPSAPTPPLSGGLHLPPAAIPPRPAPTPTLKAPTSARGRSEVKRKQMYHNRDVLVDSILNDHPTSRSGTPRNQRSRDGTHSSSVRRHPSSSGGGASGAGRSRSLPHHGGGDPPLSKPATPRASVDQCLGHRRSKASECDYTPRGRSSPAPDAEGIVKGTHLVQLCSFLKSDGGAKPCAALLVDSGPITLAARADKQESLPYLGGDKRSSNVLLPATSGSESARGWRRKAASLYSA